jgi:hypothetical protein
VIQLYAITDNPGPPLPKLAPLHLAATDRLGVVWARAEEAEPTPEALWQHEAIVEALMKDRDLLPFRYGTRVEDEAAAARTVRERGEALSRALDRVRGAVELSVRVRSAYTVPEPVLAPPRSGTEYMRAKAHTAGARAGMLALIHEPLSGHARASVHAQLQAPAELMRTAYLVDRDAVERFLAIVRRLEGTHRHLRILCTGPWPPYSFCER